MGLTRSQIARELGINIKTVRKYLKMSYDDFISSESYKRMYLRILDPYQTIVCDWLQQHPDLSSSQIHDWLREKYADLSYVNPKTVFNFVKYIRTKDISAASMQKYSRLLNADLIAIDDIMLFPVRKEDSAAFFNLINTLHEKISIIITTNKSPSEWADTLDDEVLATALLDRLLYKCEVVKLSGNSYRMENRQTILKQESKLGRPRKYPPITD